MGRWQVPRVVGMKTEPYPLIDDVVGGKALVDSSRDESFSWDLASWDLA